MKIYLGADHGGYELKEKIKGWMREWGQVNYETYEYEDLGAFELNPDDDYPDFAIKVAERVVAESHLTPSDPLHETPGVVSTFGILSCRSGAGVVMAANKVKGIRAGSAHNIESAQHLKAHNNANILAVSGDWLNNAQAKEVIKAFLETKFEAGRHQRRLDKIAQYENQMFHSLPK